MTNHIEIAGPTRARRKRELFKLMAARSDFSGAQQSCKQLLDNAPQLGSDLNYPLTVAAIVCYSRPFTKNEPYGALPNRYLRVLVEEAKIFHKEVLDARHKFFAHSDLEERTAYIHPANSVIARNPSELRSPKIGSSLTGRLYGAGFFEQLLQLIHLMSSQVIADIDDLLEELYDGMELPATKFKLRVDNGL